MRLTTLLPPFTLIGNEEFGVSSSSAHAEPFRTLFPS